MITDSHELAGLGAIRSLGRAGYRVVAGYPDGNRTPVAAWSRYCVESVAYPDPWNSQPAFREWLHGAAERRGYDLILPVTEAAIVAAAGLKERLRSQTKLVLPSESSLMFSLSKFHATRKAIEIGVPCPPTLFISDGVAGMRTEGLEAMRFPIVIKTDNQLRPDGAYEKGRAWKVASLKSARYLLADLEEKRVPIIAQEFIPGSGAGSFFLRHRDRTCLTFAHRRIHEVPYTGGWSSFRESVVDAELQRSGEALLKAIGYQGVAMVEFRRSTDGRAYFLEINGRLWGSLALALHSGVDFPRFLIECTLSDRPTPQPPPGYPIGVKCRNVLPGEFGYVMSVLRGDCPRRMKVEAVAGFFALSFNPAVHHDHFWLSDPIPGFLQAFQVVRRLTAAAIGRFRERIGRRLEERALRRLKESRRSVRAPFTRVVFVCYGNICRSPFAQAYWNARLQEESRTGPAATSYGFLERANRRSPAQIREIALSFNVDLEPHRSKPLDEQTVAAADAVFVMDRKNLRDFLNKFPWAKEKVHLLGWYGADGLEEIADPYGTSDERVRECFEQISDCIEGLMEHCLSAS